MYTSNWQAIDAFTDAMATAGLGQPEIVADGKLHRFRTPDDKAGKQSGWYLLHLDRLPAGAFGSWKSGESRTWCAKSGEEQTPAERADIRALMDEARRQHQSERDQQQRAAAIRALGIWNRCTPAPADHPYLAAKSIRAHGARLDRHGNLVIPATDGGVLTTLQFIAPDGSKRFLAGGRIAGCWFGLQSQKPGPILLGEGFATMVVRAPGSDVRAKAVGVGSPCSTSVAPASSPVVTAIVWPTIPSAKATTTERHAGRSISANDWVGSPAF